MLFPNPTTGKLTFSLDKGTTITKVTIVDSQGKVVWSDDSPTRNSPEINLSHLTAGVYLLNVRTENKVYSDKFVLVDK